MWDARSYGQFLALFAGSSWQLIPLLIGLLSIPLVIIYIQSKSPSKMPIQAAIVACIIIPLIIYAWDYNPRMPAKLAHAQNQFASRLALYSKEQGIPARLYSHERLLQAAPANQQIRRTDTISPGFWVIQPITATQPNFECLLVDLNISDNRQGDLQISIHEHIDSAPVRALTINTTSLSSSKPNPFCFDPLPENTYYVRIFSFVPTGVELTYKKLENSPLQAYFVRVPIPTPAEIGRSKKSTKLNIQPKYTTIIDREAS